MNRRLQAVYKNGVLQPLEAISLEEMQQVTVTINDAPVAVPDLAGYFTPSEWEEAANDNVGLDEVRRALSTLAGSLSDAVIALREER